MTRACRHCRIRHAMLLLITVAFAVCLAELVHRLRPRDAALSADPWSPPAMDGAPSGDHSLPRLWSGRPTPRLDGVDVVTASGLPAASPPARRAPVAVESAENQPPSSAVGGPVLSPIFPSGLPPAVYGLIDGLWFTETSRGRNLRRGDGGRAAGHFQQHKAHWLRGCRLLGVHWRWPSDTYDPRKAAHVVVANWCLDCPDALWAGDVESLARHFRLPNKPWRADNDRYWQRVREAMR